jgi:hypothetical protein
MPPRRGAKTGASRIVLTAIVCIVIRIGGGSLLRSTTLQLSGSRYSLTSVFGAFHLASGSGLT